MIKLAQLPPDIRESLRCETREKREGVPTGAITGARSQSAALNLD
jgi:hypothetical protein